MFKHQNDDSTENHGIRADAVKNLSSFGLLRYGALTLCGSDRGFYGRRINLQHCSSPVILNFDDFPRSVTADAEDGGLRSGRSRTELRPRHRACEEETLETRKTVKETYLLCFYEAPLPRQSDSVLIDLQIIFSSPSIK